MSNYCPQKCEHLVKGFCGKGYCAKYKAEIYMKYWPKAYVPPFRKCKACKVRRYEDEDWMPLPEPPEEVRDDG